MMTEYQRRAMNIADGALDILSPPTLEARVIPIVCALRWVLELEQGILEEIPKDQG